MQPTSNNSMKNLSQQAYYSYLNLLKLGQTWSNLVKLAQTSPNDVTNYKTSLNVKCIYTDHVQPTESLKLNFKQYNKLRINKHIILKKTCSNFVSFASNTLVPETTMSNNFARTIQTNENNQEQYSPN